MPFYESPGAHPTSHGLESPYGSTSQSSQGNRTGSLAAQQWHPQPYENLVPYGYVPSPPTSSNYGLGPQIPLDHHSGFTYGASPLSDQRNRPGSLARQYLQPRPQGNFVPDGYEPSPPIAPYGIEPQLARMYQSGLLFGREAPPSLPNSLGIPPPPTQLPKVPPQPDAQLRSYFHSADKDQASRIYDGAITLSRQVLSHPSSWAERLPTATGPTVWMLLGLFDEENSGTLDFQEFVGLWQYIVEWQKVFRWYDQNHSGTIEAPELASAIKQFGFNLSPTLLTLLEEKYGKSAQVPSLVYNLTEYTWTVAPLPDAAGAPDGISFEGFIRACVMVKIATDAFKRADTDNDGWININFEGFAEIILATP
ncbi:hypothetical protein FRB96_001414 [Tulasnella sp. 330]|nr:hypothetical protein FRB96_001414 [Tulasnella sp. 330]